MEIRIYPNGPFMVNTYLIRGEGNRAIILDPGSHLEEMIIDIEEMNLEPEAVVATHAHIDHVHGVPKIKERYKIPFYLNPGEHEVLDSVPMQGRLFGVTSMDIPEPDRELPASGELELAGVTFECLFTPGHSPASVSLRTGNVLFSGDVLFNMSIGRTDLPGGSMEVLMKSIRDKFLPLPGETQVLPGHGPETTLAYEAERNPFLQ
jgi:glyoxylase-like metal-dependent hydrolase (beta-lactamase superfamily II)